MEDKETIKALECCQTDHCHGSKCPLFNGTVNTKDCITKLSGYALGLINRQKAEIALADKRADMWHKEAELNTAEIIKMQAEIERLKYNLEAVLNERADHSEAIKEYIEKLKSKAYLENGVTGFQDMVVDARDIDETYDEMVGDTE